jgi:arylsulfatase A-like enzyme
MNKKSSYILIVYLLFTVAFKMDLKAQHERPNIVFIMADDLGYASLGCYGNKDIRTPNIDCLAHEGVLFTDYHSNGSLCSPTRVALLTGRYQQRAAWVPDEELSPVFQEQRKANLKQRSAWGISNSEITIPMILKGAGYKTGLIGKWHLGYDFKFHPMNYGFDEFRGFMGGNVDYHSHVAGFGLKELDWWKGKTIENEEGYTTDLLTKYAIEFIERHRTEPFFLYMTHAAPHDPWQVRDQNPDKPVAAVYKEMIEILDQSVGKIIKALKERHLEKKTIVVFCSDNGPAAPAGINAAGSLQGRKGSLYEGGHRVPFIASYPGMITPGTICNETVMSMDMFPTFAALAGARIPGSLKIDGLDITGVLFKQEKLQERITHWEMDGNWAIRKGNWKLIGTGDKGTSFFNLQEDIGEKKNLSLDYPALVDSFTKINHEWVRTVQSKLPGNK